MNTTYNSGGGGISIGAGSIATGVGGSVNSSSTSAETGHFSLSVDELPKVLMALTELKMHAAGATSSVKGELLDRVQVLERAILENPSRIEKSSALNLFKTIQGAFGAASEAVKLAGSVAVAFGMSGQV